jgi:hypothetical protein
MTMPDDQVETDFETHSRPAGAGDASTGDGMDAYSRNDAAATDMGTGAGTDTGQDGAVQLFQAQDAQAFGERWRLVQTRFVDDPRGAVKDADALVSEVMQTLTSQFADHRSSLETQWSSGADADTEDLRMAFRRYRALFTRLLAA